MDVVSKIRPVLFLGFHFGTASHTHECLDFRADLKGNKTQGHTVRSTLSHANKPCLNDSVKCLNYKNVPKFDATEREIGVRALKQC